MKGRRGEEGKRRGLAPLIPSSSLLLFSSSLPPCLCVSVVQGSGSPEDMSVNVLRAGAAEAVITPPLGVDMTGFGGRPGPASGVYRDLYVRTLVLELGGAPKRVEQPQKIFERVRSWTCTSSPITGS